MLVAAPWCRGGRAANQRDQNGPKESMSIQNWKNIHANSCTVRLAVIDSTFELIPGLRQERWHWRQGCVDMDMSYKCVHVGCQSVISVRVDECMELVCGCLGVNVWACGAEK